MTEQETPETPRPQLSARSMLAVTGAVAATFGGVVLLAAGGWIAVAGAAGATAVGAYGVHRVRHPNGKQSVIGQLLSRPRRTRTGGTLTWPFTGNQRGRALSRGSKAGSGSSGRRASLPRLTTGQRARNAKALTGTRRSSGNSLRTGGRTLPLVGRKISARRSAGTSSVTKPGRKPSTTTRTPARLSAAPKLTGGTAVSRRTGGTAPARRRSPGVTSSGSTSAGRRASNRSPWAGTGRRSTGTGRTPFSPRRRPSPGGTTSSRGSSGTSRRTPKLFSGSPRTRAGSGTKRSFTPIRNPLRTTRGSQRLGGKSGSRRSTRQKRAVRKAERLGTPKFDRTPSKTPNRASKRQTARRAIPTNRRLIRHALRMPVLNKQRTALKRPTTAQARRARRALGLRTGMFGLKLMKLTTTAPHKLAAAGGRRWWDGLQARIPGPVDPRWRLATIPDPKLTAAPGPKAARPVPKPTEPATVSRGKGPLNATLIPVRRENGDTVYMTARDAITEAMNQLALFEPQSGMEVARFMEEWNEIFVDMGTAFSTLADRMGSEMPIAAPVQDAVRDLGAGVAALSDVASDAHATMLAAHEAEINRLQNPRPNEGMWDTDRNDL